MLNDCLIFNTGDEKGKIVVPKSVIKGLRTRVRRDYGANEDKEYTLIMVDIEFAMATGIDVQHCHYNDKVIALEVADDLHRVMGMIGASAATEVLFK